MQPIRRKQNYTVHTDPITGKQRVLEFSEDNDYLTPEGSIDSSTVKHIQFLDCGCRKEPAGKCHDCQALNCENHLSHCHSCHRPICLEHTYELDLSGQSPPFCQSCFLKITNMQKKKRIFKILLSPIIDLGERK